MRINILFALITIIVNVVCAGEIKMINKFETWNNKIGSTDPAGVAYNPNTGTLFISDSEINEIKAIWDCKNIFEVSLDGSQIINTYDAYDDDGTACDESKPHSTSASREPAGITFNDFDGFFYVADDEEHAIIRYNDTFGAPVDWLNISDLDENGFQQDLEGITCDPGTGYLYVVIGTQEEVRVYNSNLDETPLSVFSVAGIASDPEGIAFNVERNHLMIVSSTDNKIYEFTVDGFLVDEYNISGFVPTPIDAEGLTFAPTSDPNDDPGRLNLYISDVQEDNDDNPAERDGIIYEAEITYATVLETNSENMINKLSLDQNYPNPFNQTTRIQYTIHESDNINLEIFNLQGQLIKKLVSDYVESGSHQVLWSGRNEQGSLVPSGVYLCRIQTGKFTQSQKMFLIK